MRPDELTRSLHRCVADLTGPREDTEDSWLAVLGRLTAAAATGIPGAAYAGFSMLDADELLTPAPSHDTIVELDRAQARLGEGPCLDVLRADGPPMLYTVDFADEPRWLRFAPAAVEAGAASLLCYALTPRRALPGAITFWSTHPRAFDDPSVRLVAAAFASRAAVAMYGRARISNLTLALATRDVIGQAKGILMERYTLDDGQAFDLLARAAQDTDESLLDVARCLTGDAGRRRDDGTLDGTRGPALDPGLVVEGC